MVIFVTAPFNLNSISQPTTTLPTWQMESRVTPPLKELEDDGRPERSGADKDANECVFDTRQSRDGGKGLCASSQRYRRNLNQIFLLSG